MRAGSLGRDHVFGDLLAHGGHGHQVAGHGHRSSAGHGRHGLRRCRRSRATADGHRRRSSRRMLLHETQDVFLGDATSQAGGRDLCQVDVVVASDAPYQRRRPHPLSFLGRRELDNALGLTRDRLSWSGRFGCGNRLRTCAIPLASRGRGRLGCTGAGRGWSGGHRFGRFCLRRSGGGRSSTFRIDHSHHRIHLHGGAFRDFNLLQHTGSGRRDLRVHLVG